MSSTVFDLFKQGSYKATVLKGRTELAYYNVSVVASNTELEKVGFKQMSLVYDPAPSTFGNDYTIVNRILIEQMFEANKTPPTIDSTIFIEKTGKKYLEKFNINNNNQQSGVSILFSLRTDGTIERSFLGRAENENYTIIYQEQPDSSPSIPNYKLWFNLVAWVSIVLILIIAILALVKAFSNNKSKTPLWLIVVLSLIILSISIASISVIYTS